MAAEVARSVYRLRYGLEGLAIETVWRWYFLYRPDRLRGPSNLLYNGYGVSFPGARQPELGVDRPPPSSAGLRMGESYTSV